MCVGLQIVRAIWIGWFGLMWSAVNLPQLVNVYCMFALWLALVPAAMQELRSVDCTNHHTMMLKRCSLQRSCSKITECAQHQNTHRQTSPQPTHTYTHLQPTDIWHTNFTLCLQIPSEERSFFSPCSLQKRTKESELVPIKGWRKRPHTKTHKCKFSRKLFVDLSSLDVMFLFLLSDFLQNYCHAEKLGWLREAVGQTDETRSALCVLKALQNHS